MLEPPPVSRESLDRGALESEGKNRYLTALERKLDRLQGSNKSAITSKDIMSSLSEAHEDHMCQFTGLEMAQDNHTGYSGDPHTADVRSLETVPADPWHATPTPGTAADPWDATPTPGIATDPWHATPTPGTATDPWHATPTPGTAADPWDATPTSGTAVDHATPMPDTNPDATPTPGTVSADPWCAMLASDLPDNTDDHCNTEPATFEVFVDIEPVRSGCCVCFRPRRERSHASALRVQEQTVEGGDSLRQVGHGLRDVGGPRTVGDVLRRTGQGLGRAGPLKSTGLGLRGVVGLGKPRRPEDGFTAEEERAFLLKCDQLEREDDD